MGSPAGSLSLTSLYASDPLSNVLQAFACLCNLFLCFRIASAGRSSSNLSHRCRAPPEKSQNAARMIDQFYQIPYEEMLPEYRKKRQGD